MREAACTYLRGAAAASVAGVAEEALISGVVILEKKSDIFDLYNVLTILLYTFPFNWTTRPCRPRRRDLLTFFCTLLLLLGSEEENVEDVGGDSANATDRKVIVYSG